MQLISHAFSRVGAVLLFVAASAAGAGCQTTPPDEQEGTGGAAAIGGASGAAGAGTGGAPGSGGTHGSGAGGSGGMVGSGGVRGNGGSIAGTGGLSGNGGSIAGTGGLSGSGGSIAGSGGTGGTGGTAGLGGTPGSGGGGTSSPLLVPAQGALLGAYVGTGTVSTLESTLGRKLAIVHNFYGWSDNWVPWARSTLQTGAVPLVTWETWNSGVGVPLDDVLGGVHDAMIRTRAQDAKAAGQRFFLRWGHEMNGNWYPWDGSHNGASAAATAKYIATFRHIHDLFVSAGATNVLWVFCPNVDSVPGDAWNQWANYYPGDTYVDWMAFDGYNWGTVQTGSSWRPFTSIAGAIYGGLAAKAKPIMIPETASTEMGGDKAAWIAAVLPALRASYPGIKALVWFHINKETDWRIDSSAASRTAFVQMANDPYFNP